VTDGNQTGGKPLEEVVAAAVAGGVNMVQLREKDLPAGRMLELATNLRRITQGRALLVVNDRIDVALLCGADGVQLGEEGVGLTDARRLGGEGLLLGRSVHGVEAADQATSDGADFLVVGTIFPTGSHPGAAAAGTELLSGIRARTDKPMLGIGGVDEHNIARVMAAGADGAAIISAISANPDPEEAASLIADQMRRAWDVSRVAPR
jgi:thiamine-phosphate pyrophosphorylase